MTETPADIIRIHEDHPAKLAQDAARARAAELDAKALAARPEDDQAHKMLGIVLIGVGAAALLLAIRWALS